VDCNPPGSSLYGILQTIKLEWVAILFSREFLIQISDPEIKPRSLIQRSNPGLLNCRQILYHLNHQGSPSLDSVANLLPKAGH